MQVPFDLKSEKETFLTRSVIRLWLIAIRIDEEMETYLSDLSLIPQLLATTLLKICTWEILFLSLLYYLLTQPREDMVER